MVHPFPHQHSQYSRWSTLDRSFIEAMVQSMYRYEVSQMSTLALPCESEMDDFYSAFCCI